MITIPEQRQFSRCDPTPYDEFLEFIPPSIYEELLSSFPPEELFTDEIPEYRKHGQRPHCRKFMCYGHTSNSKYFAPYLIKLKDLPEVWSEFCHYMYTNKQYKEWLSDMLGVRNLAFRFDFHRTKSGLDVSPHIDSRFKHASHLFYFMPKGWKEEYGGQTIFYKGLTKDILNPEPEDFTSKALTTTAGNRSCLFKNVPDGWHGVTEINTGSDIVRQIFNIVVLRRRPDSSPLPAFKEKKFNKY